MHKAHFYANLWIMRGRFFLTTLLIGLFVTWAFQPLRAADSDRDFSGKWRLDTGASDISSLGQVETNLTVSQGGGGIHCSTGADEWSYALDGT